MNTFTKFTIGSSVAVAAAALGIAAVIGARVPSATAPSATAASIIADRFVFTGESQEPAGVDLAAVRRNAVADWAALTAATDVPARKGDRLDVRNTAAGGLNHHVTVLRRIAPSASEATRIPTPDVASR